MARWVHAVDHTFGEGAEREPATEVEIDSKSTRKSRERKSHPMIHPKIVLGIRILLITSAAWAGDGTIHRADRPVPDQYIVTLSRFTAATQVQELTTQLLQQYGGKLITTYTVLFKGFAASMSEPQATAMCTDPLVEHVEEDAIGTLATSPQTIPPGQLYPSPPTNASLWGLDRIDQIAGGSRLDGFYSYCSDGTGVRAYVVDTGVLPGHR